MRKMKALAAVAALMFMAACSNNNEAAAPPASATVTPGYYKRDRVAGFDREGYFKTGDKGVVEDGTLHFLGRLGDMIKTAMANVAPSEVERELVGLAGVATAAVVAACFARPRLAPVAVLATSATAGAVAGSAGRSRSEVAIVSTLAPVWALAFALGLWRGLAMHTASHVRSLGAEVGPKRVGV